MVFYMFSLHMGNLVERFSLYALTMCFAAAPWSTAVQSTSTSSSSNPEALMSSLKNGQMVLSRFYISDYRIQALFSQNHPCKAVFGELPSLGVTSCRP